MDTLPQLAAVLFVLGLLGALLWLARGGRFPRLRLAARTPGAAPLLERVDSLALTPQHTVHIIRVAGQTVVLATHPAGCTALDGCGGGKREERAP